VGKGRAQTIHVRPTHLEEYKEYLGQKNLIIQMLALLLGFLHKSRATLRTKCSYQKRLFRELEATPNRTI
jgi:hypothetical protein